MMLGDYVKAESVVLPIELRNCQRSLRAFLGKSYDKSYIWVQDMDTPMKISLLAIMSTLALEVSATLILKRLKKDPKKDGEKPCNAEEGGVE